jgi:hypothetical protein
MKKIIKEAVNKHLIHKRFDFLFKKGINVYCDYSNEPILLHPYAIALFKFSDNASEVRCNIFIHGVSPCHMETTIPIDELKDVFEKLGLPIYINHTVPMFDERAWYLSHYMQTNSPNKFVYDSQTNESVGNIENLFDETVN